MDHELFVGCFYMKRQTLIFPNSSNAMVMVKSGSTLIKSIKGVKKMLLSPNFNLAYVR
jgi:hypothetical protein